MLAPVLFFLSSGPALYAWTVPHTQFVHSVNNAMIECRFDDALRMTDSLQQLHPEEPLAPLLRLSALGLQDLDLEQKGESPQFEHTCSLTLRLIDTLEAAEGTSSYSMTLRGFALGSLTSYHLRLGRYTAAVGSGVEALRLLREAKERDGSNADADFFLGLYNCARGELRRRLWWLLFWYPGGEQEGIVQLENSSRNGILASGAATLSLVDVYLQARRFDDAARVLQELESRFSQSRFVLWARARYFEAVGDNKRAAHVYGKLSVSYRALGQTGRYNALVTGCSQARLLVDAGDAMEAARVAGGLETLCLHVEDERLEAACRELRKIARRTGDSR